MHAMKLFAGTKNICPGTRMARSYKSSRSRCLTTTRASGFDI
jgi:hypothetical protein